MAKKPNITNVAVACLSSDRYSLSCDYDGARYHVWIVRASGEIITGRMNKTGLYKNPPTGTSQYTPEYFKTRHLDTKAKFGRELIAEMIRVRDEQNLVRKAEDNEKALQEQEARKQVEWHRQQDIIKQLKRFYQVDELDALVLAQAEHVERLQAMVKTTPQSVVNRVREG